MSVSYKYLTQLPSPTFQRALFILIASLAFTHCQQSGESVEETVLVAEKKLELEIVVHSSLEQPAKKILEGFAAARSSDQLLALNIVLTPHFEDAEQIADGRIKNDIWFSAGEPSVAWANDHLENLGSPHHDCTPIGFSPIQLIGTQELKDLACDPVSGCLWESLTAALKQKEETSSPARPSDERGFGSLLALPPPEAGPIESLSWATLFDFSQEDILSFHTSLSKERPTTTRPTFASIPMMPLPTFWSIFDKIRGARSGEYYLSLAPEALILQYNQEQNGQSPIHILPLKDRTPIYHAPTLCSSSGDWVTGEKRAVIQELKDFIRSAAGKGTLESFSYKTEPPTEKQSEWTKSKQLRTSAAATWEHLRPMKAIFIALDTSGSLEVGQRMYDVRRALSKLVAITPSRDRLALMSFATVPTVRVKFSEERSRIMEELSKLTPLGGSAVYDAIAAIVDNLATSPEGTTRQILLITDGGDIRSKLQKEQILQLATRSHSWRKSDFVVIGLQGEDSQLEEMKEIATAVNGRYLAVPSQQLESIFSELFEPAILAKLSDEAFTDKLNERLIEPDTDQFFSEEHSTPPTDGTPQ